MLKVPAYTVIRRIVEDAIENTYQHLELRKNGDWIEIEAPIIEGRYGPESVVNISELQHSNWKHVPNTTKIRVKGFGYNKEFLGWLKDTFGENLEIIGMW